MLKLPPEDDRFVIETCLGLLIRVLFRGNKDALKGPRQVMKVLPTSFKQIN